jgi:hypothetical protein
MNAAEFFEMWNNSEFLSLEEVEALFPGAIKGIENEGYDIADLSVSFSQVDLLRFQGTRRILDSPFKLTDDGKLVVVLGAWKRSGYIEKYLMWNGDSWQQL